MEEKAELPTQRYNSTQYPQLQLDTKKLRTLPAANHTETLNLDGSNDEITLFDADLRSSCDVTNSSGLNISSVTDSVIQQQILDLQLDKKRLQQVSLFLHQHRK